MTITSRELERRLERVLKLESNVTFQFSMISKLMDQNALLLLADTSLNLTAYRLMKTVETFESISIADLSRHMVTDNAQISRVATDLGNKELVEFHTDAKNKRRKLVALAPKGIALMAELAPRFAARRQQVEELLGQETISGLHESFAKLVEHFSD
ncbi:MarR family winged helix-turn-helix transcriptional regulator [Cognatishimia sp. SS12]|uniref:MarR family winged helix-turn-helix transcriptional regulator n=1 Tax=Cognatishimia sp. SS12 TaxID=2979465 RepID=UPI00232F7734|nr:MarR family winged helix-turn-helix transcriptional regulator [Cognatishimia sp. SS12]MDC0739553.1 MarR family winged helix-turn-helix transcriptional regulator [Cognatishimia sp. SS12]